jgi:positive control factor
MKGGWQVVYDLISEYEQSLSDTRKLKSKVEEKIFNLKSIIANETIPFEERAAASDQLLLEQQDKSIISGMESDLVFAIEWMLTSRRPGTTRGIERRSFAQRTKLMDPQILQTYFSGDTDTYILDSSDLEDSEEKKELLVQEALAVLAKKQREIFLLVKGQGMNLVETAKVLKISKQAVYKSLVRAERKIGEYIAKKELDRSE